MTLTTFAMLEGKTLLLKNILKITFSYFSQNETVNLSQKKSFFFFYFSFL